MTVGQKVGTTSHGPEISLGIFNQNLKTQLHAQEAKVVLLVPSPRYLNSLPELW